MGIDQILEIIERYKLRIPPTVFYELKAEIINFEEPTTKNDLGVDCISRNSAIKALDYDIKCFEFKPGVSKHMDDIAKLLNTIYETQVKNMKALPSATPQEPIFDKIRAEIERLQTYVLCKGDTKKIELAEVLEILDKYKAESEE